MHPNDGRVVSNFIVQALQNRPITLYGDGTQTSSFCYVDDLTEGFVRLMNSPDDLPGPVNLGNPSEFTMIELAQTILELTGSRSTLVYESLPQDDPKQRQPDIRQARTQLGWEPKIPLRQGLNPTIAYFEQMLRGSAEDRGAERPSHTRSKPPAPMAAPPVGGPLRGATEHA